MKEPKAEDAWLKRIYNEKKLKAEILNEAINREALGIRMDFSLLSERVIRSLMKLLPNDASQALFVWTVGWNLSELN